MRIVMMKLDTNGVGDGYSCEKEAKIGSNHRDECGSINVADVVFIPEKDFISGTENCYASVKASYTDGHMPNVEVEKAANPQSLLNCSEEFNRKYFCNAPCFAMVSCCQTPELIGNTSTKLNSASTSGNENRKHNLSQKNWFSMDGCIPYCKTGKGKEPTACDADDTGSTSNKREDSYNNVEISSSKRIISTGKRARVYDLEPEMFIEGKRLKRQGNRNGSLSRQDSSFMNWVNTISNGLIRAHDTPMKSFQHSSQHVKGLYALPDSEEDKKVLGVSQGNIGFRYLNQSLYVPFSSIDRCVDHQKETVPFKEQNVGSYGIHEGDVCRIQKLPSAKMGIFPICSTPCQKAKNIANQPCATNNVHCASLNDKKAMDVLDGSAELTKNGRDPFPTSLWITRLSTKVSSPKKLCNHPVDSLPCTKAWTHRSSTNLICKSVSNVDSQGIVNEKLSLHDCKIAVSMPSTSFRRLGALKEINPTNFTDEGANNAIGYNVAEKKNEIHSSANYTGTIVSWSGGKQDNQEEYIAARSEDMVRSNVNSHKDSPLGCGTKNLHMSRGENSIKTDKMKVAASCCWDSELIRSQVIPFYKQFPSNSKCDPEAIFEAVRRLRLSRGDIIRWMKSSVPHLSLNGFFLRLRVGKSEKGSGNAGYHVACINSSSCQRFISVSIRNSTYSISCRFISNHDFDEDELKTWWLEKLRIGSEMPSIEELEEKLQLRMKFGF